MTLRSSWKAFLLPLALTAPSCAVDLTPLTTEQRFACANDSDCVSPHICENDGSGVKVCITLEGLLAAGQCLPGETRCDGDCVDTTSSDEHCGGCYTGNTNAQRCSLAEFASCSEGRCVCEGALTPCTDTQDTLRCVDTNTDTAHCGACNTLCPDSCVRGACVPSTPPRSLTPQPHSVGEQVGDELLARSIELSVEGELDPTTLAGVFHVFGEVSGYKTGHLQLMDVGTMRFVADEPFAPGESVSVTLTGDARLVDGTPLRRWWWSFRAQAREGALVFVDGGATPLNAALGTPDNLVTGDFNGDGALDVLTQTSPAGALPQTTLFLNDSRGGFLQNSTVGILDPLKIIDTGDFDGDGDLDLVSAAHFRQTSDETTTFVSFQLALNTGDGAFEVVSVAEVALPFDTAFPDEPESCLSDGRCLVTSRPFDVNVTDLDVDGDLDVVVAIDALKVPELLVLRNLGDGDFFAERLFNTSPGGPATGIDTSKFVLTDLDLDGDPDIATLRINSDSEFGSSVFYNDARGSLCESLCKANDDACMLSSDSGFCTPTSSTGLPLSEEGLHTYTTLIQFGISLQELQGFGTLKPLALTPTTHALSPSPGIALDLESPDERLCAPVLLSVQEGRSCIRESDCNLDGVLSSNTFDLSQYLSCQNNTCSTPACDGRCAAEAETGIPFLEECNGAGRCELNVDAVLSTRVPLTSACILSLSRDETGFYPASWGIAAEPPLTGEAPQRAQLGAPGELTLIQPTQHGVIVSTLNEVGRLSTLNVPLEVEGLPLRGSATGDFDGDGTLDVLVLHAFDELSSTSGILKLWTNTPATF